MGHNRSVNHGGSLYIVLAAYNGSEYVRGQIQSIQAQTVKEWTLLVRDDGSSDDTVAIVRQFAEIDARIELIADDVHRLGSAGSFSRLAMVARERGAGYVMFADQDDLWVPTKIEVARRARVGAGTLAGIEMLEGEAELEAMFLTNQTEIVVEVDTLVSSIDWSARVIVESSGRGNAAKGHKRNQVQSVRPLVELA